MHKLCTSYAQLRQRIKKEKVAQKEKKRLQKIKILKKQNKKNYKKHLKGEERTNPAQYQSLVASGLDKSTKLLTLY